MANRPRIVISDVIALMKKGYTRLESQNTQGVGSIERHYGLDPAGVKKLFQHPQLHLFLRTAHRI